MDFLADIFCGANGVDKFLHDLMGGTATISCPEERHFDDISSQWVTDSPSSSKEVSFIPYPFTKLDENVRRSFLEEKIDMAGSVPYSDLDNIPVVNRDTITYRNETFVIVKVEMESVENDITHVTIYGKK